MNRANAAFLEAGSGMPYRARQRGGAPAQGERDGSIGGNARNRTIARTVPAGAVKQHSKAVGHALARMKGRSRQSVLMADAAPGGERRAAGDRRWGK